MSTLAQDGTGTRSRRLAGALVVLAALAVVLAPPASAEWTHVTQVSSDDAEVVGADVAHGGQKTLFVSGRGSSGERVEGRIATRDASTQTGYRMGPVLELFPHVADTRIFGVHAIYFPTDGSFLAVSEEHHYFQGITVIKARTVSPTGELGSIKTVSDPAVHTAFADVGTPQGGFTALAWQACEIAQGSCQTPYRVQARTITAAGELGPLRTLSSVDPNNTTDYSWFPSVDVGNSSDNAVIAWQRAIANASGGSAFIEATTLSPGASGTVGPVVELSPRQNGHGVQYADVAVSGPGEGRVAWHRRQTLNPCPPCHADLAETRAFSTDGVAGPSTTVLSSPTGVAYAPRVGIDSGGNTAVVWHQGDPDPTDGTDDSLQGRRISWEGVAGPVVDISLPARNVRADFQMDMGYDGKAIVLWHGEGPTGEEPIPPLQSRSFLPDSTLTPLEEVWQIAPSSPPSLSVLPAGGSAAVAYTFARQAFGSFGPTLVPDQTPPVTMITSGPAQGSTTPNPQPTFGFDTEHSEAGATFQCRLDSTAEGDFAPCSGPGNSHTPPNPLDDGTHMLDVRAVDSSGNIDFSHETRTFTVASVPPTISINDVTVGEGNGATTPATFVVSLSHASNRTINIDFTTQNGTASSGSDYNSVSGLVTIAAGDTTDDITVEVLGDTVDEPAETFDVVLSNPTNGATFAPGGDRGTATIDDDDEPVPGGGTGGGGTDGGPGPGPTCTVPNLKKEELSDAKQMIAQAGCTLGEVKKKVVKKGKSGKVLSQSPAAGDVVPAGTKVNLTVSKRKKKG